MKFIIKISHYMLFYYSLIY